MFGLGLQEILVVLVIFLILFGAKRLPDIGEGLGKTVREIRKIRDERKADKEKEKTGNLISALKKEIEDIPGLKKTKEIKETVDKLKNLKKMLS